MSSKGGYRGDYDIMEHYQEYAFIEDPAKPGSEGETVAEATIQVHDELTTLTRPLIERTYEEPIEWYYLVFKPFTRAYERNKDFFIVKAINTAKRAIKGAQVAIFTRETQSAKVHVNAIVATQQPLLELHESCFRNKYKIYCQKLHTLSDRERVLNYSLKESKQRTFYKYLDYSIYSRK